eukprot:TRINITY_DN2863_c0_g2_i1.p1 TRINITY_DN2863_c0_g2~~TRINITY_DN2863_c0_g2_i1.p1  ORF type:complete len:312 (+),score=51.74 TRINITY_DN2863_c0_g2_i1:93-1028(+)
MPPVRENTVLINTEKKGLAIAMPSSILETQHKSILKTYLVGQIARALAVFRISEIVVFNEEAGWEPAADELFGEFKGIKGPTAFMSRNLMLTECPQYLRKLLFPLHLDTRDSGALPPLMLSSHPLADDRTVYREGVSVNDDEEAQMSSEIECGIWEKVTVPMEIPVGMRVTVKMDDDAYGKEKPTGTPVAKEEASKDGTYWGYEVRTAASLSEAIGVDRYDLVIGTSERGESIHNPAFSASLPTHYRPLLVLGGPKGLEACIATDPALRGYAPEDVFHKWVNALPNQGSKTIRTEEALIMCLSALQSHLSW